MSTLSLNTYTDGAVLTAAQLNADNTNVKAVINGGLDGANLNADAHILTSQLASPFGYIALELGPRTSALGGMPAASTVMNVATIPAISSESRGQWTLKGAYWACSDVGAKTGKVKIEYGYYDLATGVFSVIDTITTITLTGPVNDQGGQGRVNLSDLLDYSTFPYVFRLVCDTQDATALSASPSFLSVVLLLQRLPTEV